MFRINRNSKQKQKSFNILAEADTDAIRHEDFEGEDHLVVPIVALIEGVIQGANATAPELALAEVFGVDVQLLLIIQKFEV